MQESNPYASPTSAPSGPTKEAREERGPVFSWSLRAATAIAFAAGFVSRMVRPMIEGPVHYEALAELAFLLMLLAALLVLCWRSPLRNADKLAQLGNLACWGGSWLGWSVANLAPWGDMTGLKLGWGLGCAAAIWIAFRFRRQPA